jgi:hypothetical protein
MGNLDVEGAAVPAACVSRTVGEGLHLFTSSLQAFRFAPLEGPIRLGQTAC